MIINAMQSSAAAGSKPLASGLSIRSVGSTQSAPPASYEKSSVYGNFEKEMSRRLKESLKESGGRNNDNSADSSMLLQSLTGAMGEIGALFGREAATKVMAGILTGTAKGVTEESLVSSIQNGLAGLSRLDPNKTKMKALSEGFNKDLSLMLEPELAGKKSESRQTVSLSYALAKHFGAPGSPEAKETGEEAGPSQNAADSAGESYALLGFNEKGKWDTVGVTKLDESEAEEIREAAEAGLSQAADLTLADLMKQENGGRIFENLATFLDKNLQDKAASLFVNDAVMTSSFELQNSPKMTEVLSQVYSKIAADGDADKLAAIENYINTDFKEALNPVLAAMQQGGADLPPLTEELGALQFNGLTGVSLAGESDVFGLNWGYEKDSAYDRSISKRFLQEDIRAVKAAQEKAEQAEQDRLVKAWDNTDAEKKIKDAQNKPNAGAGAASADKQAQEEADDLNTTLGEKFAEERRQKKLAEAMTTKFGQLSDRSREDLEQYLKDNFSEEEAEKLLEHTKWSHDLMSGLAGIHRDIRESEADGSKAESFINFLNGTLKKEVGAITGKLGGLGFEGWQALDGGPGELEAGFKFNGQETAKVIISGLEKTPAENAEQLTAETLRPPAKLLNLGTGYLIDLTA